MRAAKNILLAIVLLFSVSTTLTVSDSYAAKAKAPADDDWAEIECNAGEPNFMGLSPWYENLIDPATCEVKVPNGQDDLVKYIWTIVVNIMSMVTQVLGYVAIGMVIWGGYYYLISMGNPQRAAKGKTTIMNAVIGMIICILASTVSSAISGILQGRNKTDPNAFFGYVLNRATVWAGILCVLMVTVSGIQYAISASNPTRLSQAKSNLIYSLVGLGFVICAAAFLNFILMAIGG